MAESSESSVTRPRRCGAVPLREQTTGLDHPPTEVVGIKPHHAQGQLAKDHRDLERAIKLDPGNTVAHYNLGNIYEDFFSDEKVIPECQMAAATGLDLAHNNLGRLYILRGEYDKAVQVLQQALRQLTSDEASREASTHYNVLKNLGWAREGQQRLNEARSLLEAQPYLAAATAFIDSLRQGAGASLARRDFLDRFASVYRSLVLNTLQLGLFEQAFVMGERARSRTFLDELTIGVVTLSDTVAGSPLPQEQALFAHGRAIDDELARPWA